ncbi:putative Acetyltransferase, GNAT family [Desulfamplus magnetovallimortis]|uniref:Putative Acetyltransferase, GNAT family n=1 Tax=Desulfamplus magnetovallimortis TaxID=1246637 RepID=A0A1W1HC23_9BACT|nr:GNAT family N-acetyltransferase [Desulfamplus magnetovallimortis]SLM29952.1 putative Acetyltransferase, GNAT family [Desulfamplus magnetovallimortis]
MILNGKYLSIRQLKPEDAYIIMEWYENTSFSFYKPFLKSLFPDIKALSDYINAHLQVNPPIQIEYLILDRKKEKPTGIVSIQDIDYINKKAELALWINKKPAGRQGIEALWCAVTHAFNDLGLEKLIFYVARNNHDFLKKLENHQWTPEAILKKELLLSDSSRLDIYRYAIFPEDIDLPFWQSIKKALNYTESC